MIKRKNYLSFLSLGRKSYLRILNLSTVSQEVPVAKNKFEKNSPTQGILRKRKKHINHKDKLNIYFESCQDRQNLKPLIPDACFTLKRKIDSLYLVDPVTTKEVVSHIMPYMQEKNQVVAECSPGLGLISKELLKNYVGPIRLYEPMPEFREELKKLSNEYPGRLQLFTKNLFRLELYVYLDKMDNGNRVAQLLREIPKNSWSSDPVMTIIGATPDTFFLRHLVRALPMQTSLVAYGRIEMFLMMKPSDYLIITASESLNFISYKYLTVLCKLFFDVQLLKKIPRSSFLPWEAQKRYTMKPDLMDIDEDKLYLTHLTFKKDLPLPFDQLLPFYYFIKQLFKGKSKIIPTLESWVPGCGENIILPKVHHDNYYAEISIHTEFGELTPNQVLEVFREMYAHPSYAGSPFLSMVETELMKNETIETQGNVISPDLEKNIIEDIEVDLNNR